MPPKKKGKENDEPKEKSLNKPNETQLNEVTKEYFLIQIRDLETRLHKYQKKCDELSIFSKEIEDKYNQLVQDRKDIVEFLKKSLEERKNDINDLQDKLSGQHQANEAENIAHNQQVILMQEEFTKMRDHLSSEVAILGGKLTALEEFRQQKEKFEQDFADLQVKLENEEKSHTSILYNLERKAVVDKDRMKKEMMLQVKNVAEEFRKVSNQQMAETVKRNIRENVAFSDQLSKMGESVKELIKENDALRKKEKENKIEIEILEANQDELAKRNNSNLKLLRMVVDKAEEQATQLFELRSKDRVYIETDTHADVTKRENHILKQQVDKLQKELANTRKLLDKNKEESQKVISLKEELEDVLSSTAFTLREVLVDNPKDDEVDRTFKRQTMIERLLGILDTAAAIGKAPTTEDFIQKKSKVVMSHLHTSNTPKNQDSSVLDNSVSHFPHYKLGDLGLIPRPSPKVVVTSRIPSRKKKFVPLPAVRSAQKSSQNEMSSTQSRLPSLKQSGV